jgi:hypothetical protein
MFFNQLGLCQVKSLRSIKMYANGKSSNINVRGNKENKVGVLQYLDSQAIFEDSGVYFLNYVFCHSTKINKSFYGQTLYYWLTGTVSRPHKI